MTPQQIVAIGVRLFAVWLALTSITFFNITPATMEITGVKFDPNNYWFGAVHIVAALLLWFMPMAVAHKLLPRTQYENTMQAARVDLARVGCALMGLWLVARETPNLLWVIWKAMLLTGTPSLVSGFSAETKIELGVSACVLAIGLLFVFKASIFARIVVPETVEKL